MASSIYGAKNDNDSGSNMTEMYHLRLTPQMKRSLDARAEEIGITSSDYMRALLRLPIQLDVDHARGAWKDVEALRDDTGNASVSDFNGHPTNPSSVASSAAAALVQRRAGESDADPIDIHVMSLITNADILNLITAIDRWGVNYNQSVHTLNALARRFDDESSHLTPDELELLSSTFNALVISNDELYEKLVELAAVAKDILAIPVTRIQEIGKGSRFRGRRTTKKDADGASNKAAEASGANCSKNKPPTEASAQR